MCHNLDPSSDWNEIFANGPFSAFFNDFEMLNGPFLIILQLNGTMVQGPLPSQSLPKVKSSRSRSQCTHNQNLYMAIISYPFVTSEQYFTQSLFLTNGCIITLTQGHISKVKVTVHTIWLKRRSLIACLHRNRGITVKRVMFYEFAI